LRAAPRRQAVRRLMTFELRAGRARAGNGFHGFSTMLSCDASWTFAPGIWETVNHELLRSGANGNPK
jgi:hypothetical protein